MASEIWRLAGALCLAVLLFQAASAQTKEPDQNPAKDAPEKPTIAAPILIYNPPDLGAPTVGVAGATKPLEPTFGLIAPAHMGLTARDAPTLYWYQDDPEKPKGQYSGVVCLMAFTVNML